MAFVPCVDMVFFSSKALQRLFVTFCVNRNKKATCRPAAAGNYMAFVSYVSIVLFAQLFGRGGIFWIQGY